MHACNTQNRRSRVDRLPIVINFKEEEETSTKDWASCNYSFMSASVSCLQPCDVKFRWRAGSVTVLL